jgi:hypothetical protein
MNWHTAANVHIWRRRRTTGLSGGSTAAGGGALRGARAAEGPAAAVEAAAGAEEDGCEEAREEEEAEESSVLAATAAARRGGAMAARGGTQTVSCARAKSSEPQARQCGEERRRREVVRGRNARCAWRSRLPRGRAGRGALIFARASPRPDAPQATWLARGSCTLARETASSHACFSHTATQQHLHTSKSTRRKERERESTVSLTQRGRRETRESEAGGLDVR